MPFVKFLKDDDDLKDIIQHRPHKFAGTAELSQAILRGPSSLSEGDRELLAAVVSATNECPFCTGVHSAAAEGLGVDASFTRTIAEDIDSAPVDSKLKPLLKYVKKLTLTPYKMIQADADAVFAAGWDDDALSDAILVCALFNMANRIVDGHGISRQLPDARLRERGALLANSGYVRPEG